MTAQQDMSLEDDRLRHVVAGMLSTTTFNPSLSHPGDMLPLADQVIHHIRMTDVQSQAGEVRSVPHDPQGPFEDMSAKY